MRGDAEGAGAFVVQCVAVDQTTVSVIQRIDCQTGKGSIRAFADRAFVAVKAAID